jgi:hypothetical protein
VTFVGLMAADRSGLWLNPYGHARGLQMTRQFFSGGL